MHLHGRHEPHHNPGAQTYLRLQTHLPRVPIAKGAVIADWKLCQG